MKKVLKSILTVLIITGALGLVAFVISNNKNKNATATESVAKVNPTVAVKVDSVTKELPLEDYKANGNFVPFQELSFASEKSGRIVRVMVKEGSQVYRGQVLATIRTEQLSVDLQNAQVSYQNALSEKQRYESAFKTGGVTQQQVDNAKLSLDNAAFKLKQSQINLGDANIRATIEGVVNKRYIEPGSVVSPGTPLFDLVNVSTLKLKVNVNENQVAIMKLGDVINVTASVFPGKVFTSKVSFIAPKADNSLNFPVELQITNKSANLLKAGMYGTANFEASHQQPVIFISRKAFVGSVNSNQVFVLDNNTAKLKTVTPGRIIGEKVEIIRGLEVGEMVISSGQINLTDGTKVTVIK